MVAGDQLGLHRGSGEGRNRGQNNAFRLIGV